MKICSRFVLLCTVKLWHLIIYFYYCVIFSIIWNSSMQLPFTIINYSTEARCIHDKLDFPIKGQSPQSYNGWVTVKKETEPRNKEIDPPVTSDPGPVLYVPDNYYYYDDHVKDLSTSHLVEESFEDSSSHRISQTDDFSHTSTEQGLSTVEKFETDIHHEMSRHKPLADSSHRHKRAVDAISDPEEFDDVDDQQDNLLHMVDNVIVEKYNKTFSMRQNNVTYKPIRLTLWYDFDNIVFRNDSIEFERLKEGLDKAVQQVTTLFSVVPVQGNLFLQRLGACGGIWPDSDNPNSRKCGRIHHEYVGEKCLDDFTIPDHHLGGFATYDRNSTEPSVIHFRNGTGLPDTDTVVYIRSMTSQQCAGGSIIAYASSCQLDQFNRPIAGYANFCPTHLSSQPYDPEKFYLTVLHEFFHLLGFSQKLFKKFQTCTPRSELSNREGSVQAGDLPDDVLVCEDRKDVVDFVDRWYRVLTPSVAKEAGEHFNCSSIGGPLEGTVDDKNPRESSHWEARFIQPSLMTASIGLPHLTVLDRITLALFNDSGWYKVNTSQAVDLVWGHNAGCSFGSREYCQARGNPFFCTGSRLASGCHYLHLDKGVCKTNDFLDSCQVYKVEKGGECWNPHNARDDVDAWKGEIFNINSRCFISNLSRSLPGTETPLLRQRRSSEGHPEARCFEHRCNDSKTLEIRVRGSDWIQCFTTSTKVPGYSGYVVCPNPTSMCNPGAIDRVKALTEPFVCVKVRLTFRGLYSHMARGGADDATRRRRYDDFMNRVVVAVNNLVSGNGTAVQGNPKESQKDVISFSLKTSAPSSRSCAEAVRRLKVMIHNRILSVTIDGKEFVAVRFFYTYALLPCPSKQINNSAFANANSDGAVKVDPLDEAKVPRSPPSGGLASGIIAASVIGALCCTAFVSVGAILYFKSVAPNAIGPASTSYQPNPQSPPASASESGSVGQIKFSV